MEALGMVCVCVCVLGEGTARGRGDGGSCLHQDVLKEGRCNGYGQVRKQVGSAVEGEEALERRHQAVMVAEPIAEEGGQHVRFRRAWPAEGQLLQEQGQEQCGCGALLGCAGEGRAQPLDHAEQVHLPARDAVGHDAHQRFIPLRQEKLQSFLRVKEARQGAAAAAGAVHVHHARGR